jgi:hypothetical protein
MGVPPNTSISARGISSAPISGANLEPQAAVATATGFGDAIAAGIIPTYSYLRPDADDTTGGWRNETNATPLFPSVDEVAPANDSDFIHSSASPSADVCRFRLSNPVAFLQPNAKIRVRYRREGTGGTVSLILRLKQGTTTIATRTFSNISSSFVTTETTLTGGEYIAITDFNDLFIELQADAA